MASSRTAPLPLRTMRRSGRAPPARVAMPAFRSGRRAGLQPHDTQPVGGRAPDFDRLRRTMCLIANTGGGDQFHRLAHGTRILATFDATRRTLSADPRHDAGHLEHRPRQRGSVCNEPTLKASNTMDGAVRLIRSSLSLPPHIGTYA
jgi:hypothetical protein